MQADQSEKLIEELMTKVQRLMTSHKKMVEENRQLREKQLEIRFLVEQKEKEIAEIKKNYESLKMAKLIEASSDDKKQAKEKVRSIMREVDKCIALLNT